MRERDVSLFESLALSPHRQFLLSLYPPLFSSSLCSTGLRIPQFLFISRDLGPIETTSPRSNVSWNISSSTVREPRDTNPTILYKVISLERRNFERKIFNKRFQLINQHDFSTYNASKKYGARK